MIVTFFFFLSSVSDPCVAAWEHAGLQIVVPVGSPSPKGRCSPCRPICLPPVVAHGLTLPHHHHPLLHHLHHNHHHIKSHLLQNLSCLPRAIPPMTQLGFAFGATLPVYRVTARSSSRGCHALPRLCSLG
ncbi:uncharacterized protein BKA78DRAFT_55634 [Phyllosticta capitalensis]|uniref:uncharacterized protein n=1 Tax=Phyllosticta capitalensis TaxID=121624 RepID=UPI00312F85E5